MPGGCGGRNGRSGFSLVEAVIAITISTAVVFLASSVFLVQNDFYGFLLQRTRAQDNARTFMDVVERDVGSLVGSALVEGEASHMVLRAPQTLGAVCGVSGTVAHVHWASILSLDPAAATGIGARDPSGSWSFFPADVGTMVYDQGLAAAGLCAASGADTTGGAAVEFSKLRRLPPLLGGPPRPGDVLMVYEEVELAVRPSALDPNLLALYRGPVGGTATEYTTGVSVAARFEYQLDNSWRNRVPPGRLDQVTAVRVVASSYHPAESGVGTDAEFELTVELSLWNR
jgi:hypothetical protein